MDIEVEGTCFLGKLKMISLCEMRQGTAQRHVCREFIFQLMNVVSLT